MCWVIYRHATGPIKRWNTDPANFVIRTVHFAKIIITYFPKKFTSWYNVRIVTLCNAPRPSAENCNSVQCTEAGIKGLSNPLSRGKDMQLFLTDEQQVSRKFVFLIESADCCFSPPPPKQMSVAIWTTLIVSAFSYLFIYLFMFEENVMPF